jgi:hypothetical protein
VGTTITTYLADIDKLNTDLRHAPALRDENFGGKVSISGWEHITTTITQQGQRVGQFYHTVSTHTRFWAFMNAADQLLTGAAQSPFSERLTSRPIADLHPTEFTYGYITFTELSGLSALNDCQTDPNVHGPYWTVLWGAINASLQARSDLVATVT